MPRSPSRNGRGRARSAGGKKTHRKPKPRAAGARSPSRKQRSGEPKKPTGKSRKAAAAKRNGKKGGRPKGALSAPRHHSQYTAIVKGIGAKNAADLLLEVYLKQLEILSGPDGAKDEATRRQEIRALGDRITKLLPLSKVFQAAEAIIRDHVAKTDAPIAGPELVKNDGTKLAEPPLTADPR